MIITDKTSSYETCYEQVDPDKAAELIRQTICKHECGSCKYNNKNKWQLPCKRCCHAYDDRWEWKDGIIK